jgi:hypothetical protein
MSNIRAFLGRLLRGPRASRILAKFGIDPRVYWLLVDLFGDLSERGEMLDQLGHNGVALKAVAQLYLGISVLLTALLAAINSPPAAYYPIFLVLTGFVLLGSLLSETGNSLVNPVEGLVLAHQPINGATYTAAKLTHLVRIVLYFVPAVNVPPALGTLLLKNPVWWHPFVHLAAAFALGLLCALLCCAAFGWLMRLVPPRRLKAIGQLAGTVPFLGMMWFGSIRNWFARTDISHFLPSGTTARWGLAAACFAATAAIVLLGIRSLSADYLIRVSGMMRGAAAPRKTRRMRIGESAAGAFSGPSGRAGYAYVSRMMLRDWHFCRQLLPLLACCLIGFIPLIAHGWKVDPFSRQFSTMHVLPHACGMVLFFVITLLPFGSDYKGSWLFLTAPAESLGGFARGIYFLLWTRIAVLPTLLLLPFLAWSWPVWHAALFAVYSVAVVSLVLALELRLIDSVPFTRPMDPSRGSTLLPLMFLGGLAMALVVSLQYYFLFRSPALVAAATLAAGAAAWWLTQSSFRSMEASMRYNLGLISSEAGDFYKEVL